MAPAPVVAGLPPRHHWKQKCLSHAAPQRSGSSGVGRAGTRTTGSAHYRFSWYRPLVAQPLASTRPRARSRQSLLIAGVVMAVVVVTFGTAVGYLAMPALAAR